MEFDRLTTPEKQKKSFFFTFSPHDARAIPVGGGKATTAREPGVSFTHGFQHGERNAFKERRQRRREKRKRVCFSRDGFCVDDLVST